MEQQTNNQAQDAQNNPAQQTGNQNETKDPRQQAVEQEADTARLRSERQSVQDGSGTSGTQEP